MSTCSEPNPLRRDGLSQAQRQLPALDPSSVKIDERTGDDLLAFAAEYARTAQVRFYAADSADPTPGAPAEGADTNTWARLMTPPAGQTLADLEARADNPPHLALFLAFLKLFGLAQDQLNAFTQRHLDFYYRDVLRLHGRPAVPDQVHLTFELARNVAEHILPAGTEFDAGLDALEQPLRYRTAAARVVNRASLAHLRTVSRPVAGPGPVRFAPNAATADGVAAPLPATDPSWSAFGTDEGLPEADNWPEAEVGFALAAPVLRLAEGQRRITVTLTPATPLANAPAAVPLRVQLSGPMAWIEVLSDTLTAPRLTRTAGGTYTFSVLLPATEKQPVVGYNAALLDGGYGTTLPVLRVLLPRAGDYAALSGLTLRNMQIDVQVQGLQKTLVLDNDLGPLNPEKPFLPFGPVPAAGATLYVDCPETADKSLSSVTVRIPGWVGKPADWKAHYLGYPTSYQTESQVKVGVKVQNRTLHPSNLNVALFSDLNAVVPGNSPEKTYGLQLTNPAAAAQALVADAAVRKPSLLFRNYEQLGADFREYSPLRPTVEAVVPPVLTVGERLLTIQLRQDLGQQAYPALLTKAALGQAASLTLPAAAVPAKPSLVNSGTAVTTELTATPPLIPNAPYAPLAQSLTLDYAASSGAVDVSVADEKAFSQRPVQLFHQSVFGQAEEHVLLKQNLAFLQKQDPNASTSAFLLPQLAQGGTFLVGLRDVGPRETVAILFQVAEGSANPERLPARVVWSVLCQNQWMRLEDEHTPVDHTDQLLTSGIIEFDLPAETRLDNTLLESGLVWLRGELQTLPGSPESPQEVTAAPPDSVARLVALHPQAVLARFAEAGAGTDPAHYAAPLPAGTITQTRLGAAGLQTVGQPYPSFGGQPAESDAAFYARVSERLRHKQRAVTIWDYEHLLLERFPDLYKVQCLNHTQVTDKGRLQEMAPGHVTLVAVPNLRHAYAANPLAPKVSPRTLAAMQAFAKDHAGPQVHIQAVNPTYEEVQVGGKVAFRAGYPGTTYLRQLAQDLRAYLSPWAYAATADLTFGGTLHKSTLLAFIEQLPYVDFVTELTLRSLLPGAAPDQETVAASAAWSVLVSARTHLFLEISRPVPAPF